MDSLVSYVLERLKEPSTYAGLVGILGAAHVAHAQDVASALQYIGIGAATLFSAVAILAPEKK